MCLLMDISDETPTAQVAAEDLHVFKVLVKSGESYFSPYKLMDYKFRELYLSRLHRPRHIVLPVMRDAAGVDRRGYWAVEEGLHAFMTYEKTKDTVVLLSNFDCGYNYNESDLTHGKVVVCNAIIPKDALHYVGRNGDIVADRLMVIDEVVA